MQSIPPMKNENKPINHWWYFLWGFLAGLSTVAVMAVVILLSSLPIKRFFFPPTPNPVPDAHVTLEIAPDGCGLKRGEVTGSTPVSGLTWVIAGEDGYPVLERNAEGEYSFRYFSGGHYQAYVSAWYLDRYVRISDEVSIDC